MGFINSLFNDSESVSAKFEKRTESKDASNNRKIEWSTIATTDCLFWQGSAAEAVVSERFKAQIEGVLVVDYEDYTAVADKDRVTINNTVYSILHADDIAFQNKVVVIAIEAYN